MLNYKKIEHNVPAPKEDPEERGSQARRWGGRWGRERERWGGGGRWGEVGEVGGGGRWGRREGRGLITTYSLLK
jgi:hypothetical protein